MPMSKTSIYEPLTSTDGENFTAEALQYVMDCLKICKSGRSISDDSNATRFNLVCRIHFLQVFYVKKNPFH